MSSSIVLACLIVLQAPGARENGEARQLIATMESLMRPMVDFRCEFEGTVHFPENPGEAPKPVDKNGLYDEFSGRFLWKEGGDTHCDTFHRMGDNHRIMHETLVVRVAKNQAEHYFRNNDAPLGVTTIETPERANSWNDDCPGWIFQIDKIKRQVFDEENHRCPVHDETIEGRPLKVLEIAMKGMPKLVYFRYWIDLRRSGQVVRRETYDPDHVMNSRLDVKLAPFKVDDAEVWMPVHGETVAYGTVIDKKPVTIKQPTMRGTIYVVDGTMEFNKRPGPEVFTIKYKPGTPVSDNLRKLRYEFGQQKISPRPTKAEAEKMLNEQVAEAERQKKELVASPAEGIEWSKWLTWGFGGLVVVSSIFLGIQRRGR